MSEVAESGIVSGVHIQGFKSIVDLKLPLGRVTCLIGENGAGKSNLLEALAVGSAELSGHADHEFLAARGIRASEWMASGFEAAPEMLIELQRRDGTVIRNPMGDSYYHPIVVEALRRVLAEGGWESVQQLAPDSMKVVSAAALERIQLRWAHDTVDQSSGLARFLIFSPEYSALRVFRGESQILPLGVHGEGLFGHLKDLANNEPEVLEAISDDLRLLGWYDGFGLPEDLGPGERTLKIRDGYLREGLFLDQRSTNEGFLFLLFYFTLLRSKHTPSFFAIDNIDASLNPKLCVEVVRRMVKLAAENDKQILFTTHNPSVLDGLDLSDDEQRLYAVSRTSEGHTKVRGIHPPKPIGDDLPVPLSEAFVKGYLGGLPKNF